MNGERTDSDDSSTPPPDFGSTPTQGRSNPESSAATNHGPAALAFALALASLATAGGMITVQGTTVAAAGAVALGLGFGTVGGLALTGTAGVDTALADGWTEHRPYVWFAAGLFALGAVFGGLLVAAGIDLTELILELVMEEFDEESFARDEIQLSASFFVVQNTPPFLVAILGALTLGVVTAVLMLFNGVLIGNLAIVAGLEIGFGPIAALLVPHGIFELPALFIASGVGFRFVHRAVQRVVGSRGALLTRSYVYRTTLLVVFGWLLLVLAAFVEAYLTVIIAELLFPQLAG